MTARTAEEAKEEVRNASDIVQIVGERVPLRRMGRAWKGLCPFHAEKTPSFTVNSERQMWHCFGCNRGGDVFSFLMEIDKVTFPEALAVLAERAAIELPPSGRSPGDGKRDRLYQANALANDFFRATLRSAAGAKARAYLAGRGFDEALLERFQVGWAPEGWDGLSTALGKLLPPTVLEEAGLVLRRGDGTHYDRFRGRVTFPIEAAAGRVAGFGARSIAPEESPKYINSPETPVYRKGGLLFGLPLARAEIRERKRIIVAEGYLDVMRLRAAGYPHAVSTCGTALTTEQARALARFEAEVLLVYDGDDAGVRAADRALEPLLMAGLAVRVLILPDGEDPDSFIAKHGAAAFEDLQKAAGDVAAFLAGAALAGEGANPSPEARVKRYVELLGKVDDPIRRRLMLRRGAAAFGLEEEVLLEALSKRRGPRRFSGGGRVSDPRGAGVPEAQPRPAGAARGTAPLPGSPGGAAAQIEAPELPEVIDPIEKELAARCLTEEGAIAEVVASGGVNCFHSSTLQALLRSWIQMARAPLPEEVRALTDMEPMARALLAEHGTEEARTDEMSRRGAQELLQRLEERRLRASIHELDQAIRQAERARDAGSLDRLVAERRDLASKLHSASHPAIS
jgi:DNA primase